MSEAGRVVAIVTSGSTEVLAALVALCGEATRGGTAVVVFFRDESIPAICEGTCDPETRRALAELAGTGRVRLYACSSSAYLWGVTAADLIAAIGGVRGLVAFLAEDLAGASEAFTL